MAEQTNRIVLQLNNATKEQMIDLTLRIQADLVEATPVDTGWAQNNWLMSTGAPIEQPAGSPESVDSATAARGIAMVLRYNLLQGVIYLTNNVPYIQVLNGGSSAQAPANFVQMAIQRNVAISNRRTLS